MRAEGGFTLIVTMGVLLVSSLLLTATFVAAEGDIQLTRKDNSAKKAYYAAQAGVNNYAFHLNRDVNYWTYCNNVAPATENKSLNQEGSTANRAKVLGTTDEEYAIQLLPASTAPAGDKKCDSINPVSTMIESGSNAGGTFRIESTGYSGAAKRTMVASFGHTSFLNFIYYTKYETLDPTFYSPPKSQCAAFRASRPSECTNINFTAGDTLNGPVHTEDTAQICGEPIFGRSTRDLIEFKGGWVGDGGCSNDKLAGPGTFVPKENVSAIEPPPSNATLKAETLSAYRYTGRTKIALEGEVMRVTNSSGVTTSNVAFPSNGLIYVSSGTCSVTTYTPYNPTYTNDTGCGNVYVHGNYTKSLTIAAENDVVIDESITTPVNASGIPTTNSVLGLIANNFVRIYHPMSGSRGSTRNECGSATNNSADLTSPTIYAAILAVNHSFQVDNFDCGAELGKLNVHGAIAQIFRGAVGESGSPGSGYLKNYVYDDRLQVESPPSFLSPVKASWQIKRETLAPSP